jgi:hypothetical protein
MKKTYKVIVQSNTGAEKTVTHNVPEPGLFRGPLKIKAASGLRYQLVDVSTGQGPDNIRAKRVGKDLRISFEGRDQVDVMLINYYDHVDAGFSTVIGETDPGVFFAYLPESGEASSLMGSLREGQASTGMALGGDQLVASGAAVGALVAAAGFNPLLAAPLALLGAGGGGGGGGGGEADTTPPKVLGAGLHADDDTGVSHSDGITSDNTQRLLILADPDAVSATVTVNGKTYTTTTKNEQGQFVVQLDELENGRYPFSVQVNDLAGNISQPFAGQTITVDRSSKDNFSPNPANDPNQGVKVLIRSLEADTGFSANDFLTRDKTPTFMGTLDTFINNGAHVQVSLFDPSNALMATRYVRPENASPHQWSWTMGDALPLSDGVYTLNAQLTDLAGNFISEKTHQKIVITTQTDPALSAAKLSNSRLDEKDDSGKDKNDHLTSNTSLNFTGSVSSFAEKNQKLLVDLIDVHGTLLVSQYVTPNAQGQWQMGANLGQDGEVRSYVMKVSVVDLAGNMVSSMSRSLVIDRESPTLVVTGGKDNVFEKITFKASEAGEFFSGLASFDNGLTLVSHQFDKGAFSLSFKDLVGNETTLVNGDPWQINDKTPVLEVGPSPASFVALTGPVGSYQLGADQNVLDLASLDNVMRQVGDRVAINHVSMRDTLGDDVLTVSMGDVLSLGVANSFTNSGHLQMRIDGDAGDRVLLDSLVGSSKLHAWSAPLDQSLGSSKYLVYSNSALGLDLFIQQGVVTTVL